VKRGEAVLQTIERRGGRGGGKRGERKKKKGKGGGKKKKKKHRDCQKETSVAGKDLQGRTVKKPLYRERG